jgi:hypothetical protein
VQQVAPEHHREVARVRQREPDVRDAGELAGEQAGEQLEPLGGQRGEQAPPVAEVMRARRGTPRSVGPGRRDTPATP